MFLTILDLNCEIILPVLIPFFPDLMLSIFTGLWNPSRDNVVFPTKKKKAKKHYEVETTEMLKFICISKSKKENG